MLVGVVKEFSKELKKKSCLGHVAMDAQVDKSDPCHVSKVYLIERMVLVGFHRDRYVYYMLG